MFSSSAVEVHACNTKCNEDIDVEVSLKIVIEENLTMIAKLSKTTNSNMIASIIELARKNT